jgi:hypothetical protein
LGFYFYNILEKLLSHFPIAEAILLSFPAGYIHTSHVTTSSQEVHVYLYEKLITAKPNPTALRKLFLKINILTIIFGETSAALS